MRFFREFRRIDRQQSASHLFHPSTEEILQDRGGSAFRLWLVLVFGCVRKLPAAANGGFVPNESH